MQALYPVPRLLRSVALPAPPPDARLFRHEAVEVKLAYAEALRGQGGGLNRLHLVMRLPKPGWGVLNVTGPVVAWSFAEEVPEVLMPITCFNKPQFAPDMHLVIIAESVTTAFLCHIPLCAHCMLTHLFIMFAAKSSLRAGDGAHRALCRQWRQRQLALLAGR